MSVTRDTGRTRVSVCDLGGAQGVQGRHDLDFRGESVVPGEVLGRTQFGVRGVLHQLTGSPTASTVRSRVVAAFADTRGFLPDIDEWSLQVKRPDRYLLVSLRQRRSMR